MLHISQEIKIKLVQYLLWADIICDKRTIPVKKADRFFSHNSTTTKLTLVLNTLPMKGITPCSHTI